MQREVKTLNSGRKIGSEYEVAFTAVDGAFNEYCERLNFRLNKRNSEYAHHPFLWDSDSEFEPSDHETKTALQCSHADVSTETAAQNSSHTVDRRVHGDTFHSSVQPVSVKHDLGIVANSDDNHQDKLATMKESGTQTVRPRALHQHIEARKSFVPYAVGCSDPSSIKRTFNVKSESDVYPSAIRAEARRRERLLRLNSFNSGENNFTKSHAYSQQFDHLMQVRSRLSGEQRCEQKSPPLSTAQLNPASGISQKISQDERPSNGPGYRKNDVWLSEYNRQYPIYPASVYARSASLAAGRCRPLSARYGSAHTRSLVPSHPVLLSSRGAPDPRSNRQHTFKHWDECCSAELDGSGVAPILSAR
ncbi:hypothetical protein EG68_07838 [Paragonimus skrjabini miyazakii]|uniref:Uncharacterized protein n=1 Tax=Paragonimus skrjabini miyazakii TaxID=59628 RepID=A0A8S9YR24_9TREM|nr:hypothetical protein EG68_07838 [Paragonimus skrjabini miyazakii]